MNTQSKDTRRLADPYTRLLHYISTSPTAPVTLEILFTCLTDLSRRMALDCSRLDYPYAVLKRFRPDQNSDSLVIQCVTEVVNLLRTARSSKDTQALRAGVLSFTYKVEKQLRKPQPDLSVQPINLASLAPDPVPTPAAKPVEVSTTLIEALFELRTTYDVYSAIELLQAFSRAEFDYRFQSNPALAANLLAEQQAALFLVYALGNAALGFWNAETNQNLREELQTRDFDHAAATLTLLASQNNHASYDSLLECVLNLHAIKDKQDSISIDLSDPDEKVLDFNAGQDVTPNSVDASHWMPTKSDIANLTDEIEKLSKESETFFFESVAKKTGALSRGFNKASIRVEQVPTISGTDDEGFFKLVGLAAQLASAEWIAKHYSLSEAGTEILRNRAVSLDTASNRIAGRVSLPPVTMPMASTLQTVEELKEQRKGNKHAPGAQPQTKQPNQPNQNQGTRMRRSR